MSGDDQPTTEELRALQTDRREEEQERAEKSERPEEERTHGRRADKAAYLAEKLDEQAEALDE
jgi:hypothetical protein